MGSVQAWSAVRPAVLKVLQVIVTASFFVAVTMPVIGPVAPEKLPVPRSPGRWPGDRC
jgi:hypothetical protein